MTATKQQPIAGYRISDPSDPTIKPWLSDTPDDNGYTSEPLYAGAAPAAVARPASHLTELAMLNKLIELGTQAYGALAESNSDDGHAGTAAYVRWQERRAEMGELIRAYKAPALEAPAAPAAPAPKFDLRTSDGGRGYVAWHFANVLKRHDFHNYIHNTLAADFACALARALETPDAQCATDDAIDAIVLRQTGFDGDGYQAMTADELRRIVRSALGELAAAPQAPAVPVAVTTRAELEKLQGGAGSMATIFPTDASGFPVRLYAEPAAPAVDVLSPERMREEFTAWAEVAYRHEEEFSKRDFEICLKAWRFGSANALIAAQAAAKGE